jgi:hypothetical protein
MNATKLYLNDISEYLGPKEDRYFSSAFRDVHVSYKNVNVAQGCCTAVIAVQFETWSKKNGEKLMPHLGTTEFISIAAVISQQLLEKEADVTQNMIGHSWIRHFSCKMKPCNDVDIDNISLSGRIVSKRIEESSIVYEFEIQIGRTPVVLEICCPVKKCISDTKIIESVPVQIDFYREGYKLREHAIKNVCIDGETLKSDAVTHLYEKSATFKGLCSHCYGMLLTDFVLITGQLTQALLCHINHISRAESSNLWLREIDAWCHTPPMEKTCSSTVHFLNLNTLRKKEELWQSVELYGTVGNIHSTIKVAQKIN